MRRTFMFLAAAIQIISTTDIEHNLKRVEYWVAQAAERGAKLAVLPENFASLGSANPRSVAEQEEANGTIRAFLSRLANTYGIAIIGGTLPTIADAHGVQLAEKVYAACHCYDATGTVIGRYDKVHLFDAAVADAQATYSESSQYAPGKELGVIAWGGCSIGVAVCYDLRFPEYFRHLADHDVAITAVPSAFTEVTGEAHWQVLLRARAIENQMFIVAANQGGRHDAKRVTYGHSCIIDPWGTVLDEIGTGEGIAMAMIDLDVRSQLQAKMPVLAHRVMWAQN